MVAQTLYQKRKIKIICLRCKELHEMTHVLEITCKDDTCIARNCMKCHYVPSMTHTKRVICK